MKFLIVEFLKFEFLPLHKFEFLPRGFLKSSFFNLGFLNQVSSTWVS